MNYKEMRYVVPPDPPKKKIITPGEVYSESVLVDIPNIIGDIWEIIDFRPLKKGDGWIAVWGSIYDSSECSFEDPRFVIQRKITNEDRVVEDIDNEIRKERKK